MTRNFAIRRLLAIVVIVCLVLAPAFRLVMAASGVPLSSDVAMQTMAHQFSADADDVAVGMVMDDEMDMSGHMPCCPPKAPATAGCDKCVCMAACGSSCLVGTTGATPAPPLTASGDIALLKNDAGPDGLGHPPPEHPPRTRV